MLATALLDPAIVTVRVAGSREAVLAVALLELDVGDESSMVRVTVSWWDVTTEFGTRTTVCTDVTAVSASAVSVCIKVVVPPCVTVCTETVALLMVDVTSIM